MEVFKERLRERSLDTLDWIDYRPDPHWWQYIGIPVVLAAAYFFTPMHLWLVILMATIAFTFVAMGMWFLGIGVCIAWKALRDVIEAMKRNRRRRAYGPAKLIARLN